MYMYIIITICLNKVALFVTCKVMLCHHLMLFSPNAILSAVASRLIQNPTHDMTTSREQGTYNWMTKKPQ